MGQSLWHDEAYTVTNYISGGPSAIWNAAAYVPNNHVLYSTFSWASSPLFGTSEMALRLWSVIPGIVGAVLLCTYVYRWLSAGCALIVGLLVTVSSSHQELTVQARGYGLAFFFGCVLLVAGDSSLRRPDRTRYLVLAGVAGWAGSATINVFAIGAVAVFAVLLLALRNKRKQVLIAAALMGVAIVAWWAPLLPGILENADQQYGRPLSIISAFTGWIDDLALTEATDAMGQNLNPAAAITDLSPLAAAFTCLGVVVALLLTALTLVRQGQILRLLLLLTPLVLTYVVLGIGRFYVSPRFSFHLLPFFLVAVTYGPAKIVHRAQFSARERALLAVVTVALLTPSLIRRLEVAVEAHRLPLEAFAEVGEEVRAAPLWVGVSSNTVRPTGLRHYMDRSFRIDTAAELERRICEGSRSEIVIDHPYRSEPLQFRCERQVAARRTVLQQRIRGPHIIVWHFPRRRPD